VIHALEKSGIVRVEDGRRFRVQQGRLDQRESPGSVWRITTKEGDAWLSMVESHTWKLFRDLGKIRVGVKTCADRVFIRDDWHTFPKAKRPELLRTLSTHHVAGQFRANEKNHQHWILYPHNSVNGKRQAVDLENYPKSKAYLSEYREVLESRKYLMDAGRRWYEIWVPQAPREWNRTKLVFRDISQRPCFWMDKKKTVVNGDCYWMTAAKEADEPLLWLALAVGNSTFIEAFYDRRFNNKLYAGRRRFITQYVERFPLPDPETTLGQQIMATAKALYASNKKETSQDLDRMVWKAFGF